LKIIEHSPYNADARIEQVSALIESVKILTAQEAALALNKAHAHLENVDTPIPDTIAAMERDAARQLNQSARLFMENISIETVAAWAGANK
jgi:hypothetical protein